MVNQLRITVPKWVVDLKNWKGSHLELVPITRDDNLPITKETVFVIKEVKK